MNTAETDVGEGQSSALRGSGVSEAVKMCAGGLVEDGRRRRTRISL